MQERFDRLENLVLNALSSSRVTAPGAVGNIAIQKNVQNGEDPQPDRNIGLFETDSGDRHLYSGETAWNTVLHEVG